MASKIIAAITGNIGSGKSEFSKHLVSMGFDVLDADSISKNLLSENTSVKSKIIKAFGAAAYLNGEPNKKFLADVIFNDEKKLAKINSILHPEVIRELEKRIKAILEQKNLVFVEAALIYEAKLEKLFDYVILISANPDTRKKRKCAAGYLTPEEFTKRNNMQIDENQKAGVADYIFSNDGTLEDLYKKADLLVKLIGVS